MDFPIARRFQCGGRSRARSTPQGHVVENEKRESGHMTRTSGNGGEWGPGVPKRRRLEYRETIGPLFHEDVKVTGTIHDADVPAGEFR